MIVTVLQALNYKKKTCSIMSCDVSTHILTTCVHKQVDNNGMWAAGYPMTFNMATSLAMRCVEIVIATSTQ